ncbi:MAG: hypothetical protein LBC18_11005, partial [Opitutaceae bacterium]|nr:hypothetical protein [Opitutaceae bacterium]
FTAKDAKDTKMEASSSWHSNYFLMLRSRQILAGRSRRDRHRLPRGARGGLGETVLPKLGGALLNH